MAKRLTGGNIAFDEADVAIYSAVIGREIEKSHFGLNSFVPTSDVINALRAPDAKGIAIDVDVARVTNGNRLAIEVLRRMKRYIDLVAFMPDGSSEDIFARVGERFATQGDANSLSPAIEPRLPRFQVLVCLELDGDVWWETEMVERGDAGVGRIDDRPFGKTKRSNIDIYLRNMIRADLQREVERLETV